MAQRKRAQTRARPRAGSPSSSSRRGLPSEAIPTGATHLVIVESPAKARTIERYLGPGYIVQASLGHIKDLPEYSLGVDISNGFRPQYQILPTRGQILQRLKSLAQHAEDIFLATDPDREGEAIAWHIAEELRPYNGKIRRVLFHEITRSGIQQGIAQWRELNEALVLSQQARRVMDRLIGYEVSPWLSDVLAHEVTHALSAGRVQSVALRLICEREALIESFQPIPFWTLRAQFALLSGEAFWAELVEYEGKPIRNPNGSAHEYSPGELQARHYIRTEAEAEQLAAAVRACTGWAIAELRKRHLKRSPPPPFTTSLLQQEASRRLGLSPRQTMRLAQQLYEGVPLGSEGPVGLITYMRTDSTRISHEAQLAARRTIAELFGEQYLPPKPPQYSSRSAHVQDAHEAIRPTHLEYTPERVRSHVPDEMAALYELIYTRFLASQMAPAEVESTTVLVAAGAFRFRTSGSIILFEGFLRAYAELSDGDDPEEERQKLPSRLSEGLELVLTDIAVKGSQTKPPSRYTEATLIKELDEKGIGRPSTYATIVGTLFERRYVQRRQRYLLPTPLGRKVNDILVNSFPDIFTVGFTAAMEEQLDAIAEEQLPYQRVLENFYAPFRQALEQARQQASPSFACPHCGSPMKVERSRRGKRYLRCSSCGATQPLPKPPKEPAPLVEHIRCPLCGAPMVQRQSKYGAFYGCSRYPACTGTRPLSSGVRCPQCGEGELLERTDRRGRRFWGCSRYPDCRYVQRHRPIPVACPQCGHPFLEEHSRWQQSHWYTLWRCPHCQATLEPSTLEAEATASSPPSEIHTPETP